MAEWSEKFANINQNFELGKKSEKEYSKVIYQQDLLNIAQYDYQAVLYDLMKASPNCFGSFYLNQPLTYFTISRDKLLVRINQNFVCYEKNPSDFFGMVGLSYDDTNKEFLDVLAQKLKLLLLAGYQNEAVKNLSEFMIYHGLNTADIIKQYNPLILFDNLCISIAGVYRIIDEEMLKWFDLDVVNGKKFFRLLTATSDKAFLPRVSRHSAIDKHKYSLFFIVKNKNIVIYFDQNTKEIRPEFKAISVEGFHRVQKLYSDQFIELLNASNYVPPACGQLLSKLTNGNLHILDQFAQLSACVLGDVKMMKRMTVIMCHESLMVTIENFLEQLIESGLYAYSLDLISTHAGLRELINAKINGGYAIYIKNSQLPTKMSGFHRIKELISGKKIIQSDKLLGHIVYSNTLPIIYVTNDHDKVVQLRKAEIPLHFINMQKIKIEKENGVKDLGEMDITWLRAVFALHGLRCIAGYKGGTSIKPVKKVSPDEILNQFVADCCVLSSTSRCINSTIYEAYKKYYEKLYGLGCLTEIVFCKKIFQMETIKRIRIHGPDHNYRGFEGIAIDENKIKDVMGKSSCTCSTTETPSFDDYLKGMHRFFIYKNDNVESKLK